MGKGDHQITSSWTDQFDQVFATTLGITRSNITFLGKGKDITTILGGFGIHDIENITFKNMAPSPLTLKMDVPPLPAMKCIALNEVLGESDADNNNTSFEKLACDAYIDITSALVKMVVPYILVPRLNLL